jgi:hypothetical protein
MSPYSTESVQAKPLNMPGSLACGVGYLIIAHVTGYNSLA